MTKKEHRRAISIVGLLAMCSSLLFVSTFVQSAPIKIHALFQAGRGREPVFEKKDEIEERTGVELNIEQVPGENLYEKLMVDFIAQAGAYDLIEFYPAWIGDFVEAGFLLNLDPYFTRYTEEINPDDYIQGAQVCKWRGSWYAVPYSSDVNIFYYRKDLLEDSRYRANFKKRYGYELRVPDTWDKVIDIAEFFNGWDWDDDGKVNYGIGLISRGWFAVSHWSNVYRSYGGEFFDETGRIALDRRAFIKANEVWMTLLEYAPPGALNFGYGECFEVLAQGQVAMAIQWAIPIFRDSSQCAVYDKLGYAVMPGVKQPDGTIYRTPALAGGKCLAVPVTSQNPDKAFKIAMYLSSEKMQVYHTISRSGINPSRRSVFEVPGAKEVWGEMIPVYKKSLRIGRRDIRRRGSGKFYEVIYTELSSLWAAKQIVETAYERILSQWSNVVEELPEELPPGPTKQLETAIINWNEYYGTNVRAMSWSYKGKILSETERTKIVKEMTDPEKAWFPDGDVADPTGVTVRQIKDYPTITSEAIRAWQKEVTSRVAVNNHIVEIRWKFSFGRESFKTICIATNNTLKYDSMLFNGIMVRQRSLDMELLWMWGTKRGEITAKVIPVCQNSDLIDCEHECTAWLTLGSAEIKCRVSKDSSCCRLQCNWAFVTPLFSKITVGPDGITLEVKGLGFKGMGSSSFRECCD